MEKEFTKNLGDKVWIMHNNLAQCGEIVGVTYDKFIDAVGYEDVYESEKYSIQFENGCIRDCVELEQIFATKEELINSL